VADAIEVIARLVPRFGGRVWLVSKCGPRVQARTERWLAAHRFFERTGISEANLRFCRQRPDKRQHCLELDLTHFIDDRADVHEAIHGVVEHQFYFGPHHRSVPSYGVAVADWQRVEAAIIATL
jgi:hypothetical protein